MRYHRHLLAAMTVAAVTLAGCSSDEPPVVDDAEEASATDDAGDEAEPEPDPEPDPEPEPEPEPEDELDDETVDEVDAPTAARAYFDAFATFRPSTMEQMLDHAADGSPAHVYAAVQIANATANLDQGWPVEPAEATVTDTGMRLCTDDLDGGRTCTDMEELTVTDGKLVSFTVDGTPIADRLAAGGPSETHGGTVVTLLGAYHSVQADALIVALDVANDGDEPVRLHIYSAEYVNNDGRQVTASDATGPYELRSGAAGALIVVFPAQGVGGTLYLQGASDDFMADYEWQLPLEQLS